MRGLIIVGVLCSLVWTSQARSCKVAIRKPNKLKTFDGATVKFDEDHKYLLSSFPGVTSEDQCKFQVRMQTAPYGVDQAAVEWIGIAFGVHTNPDKFERNFQVSENQGEVQLRGRGLKPVPVTTGSYETGPNPLDWVFKYSNNPDAGTMEFEIGVPDFGCHVYVSYQEAGTGASPLDHDSLVISTDKYYNRQLLGYCGDSDGDESNDDQFCPVNTGNPAVDCIDGDHQANP